MRSSIGGCVGKLHQRDTERAKNMCESCSLPRASTAVGARRARIESSAPAIDSGLRVNCTLAASARNSRCREMEALIASAAKLPGKPMNATSPPRSALIASGLLSSLGTPLACQAARYTSFSPCSLNQVSPARMPTSRRLSAMSPLRMWLNSWPMTPCSSSRDSCCTAPWVTMINAWWGVCPATRALIAVSRSSRYTGGTAMPEAIAISSTTLSSRRSGGLHFQGST